MKNLSKLFYSTIGATLMAVCPVVPILGWIAYVEIARVYEVEVGGILSEGLGVGCVLSVVISLILCGIGAVEMFELAKRVGKPNEQTSNDSARCPAEG